MVYFLFRSISYNQYNSLDTSGCVDSFREFQSYHWGVDLEVLLFVACKRRKGQVLSVLVNDVQQNVFRKFGTLARESIEFFLIASAHSN